MCTVYPISSTVEDLPPPSDQQGGFFAGLYSGYNFPGSTSYGGNQGNQPQVEFQHPFRPGISQQPQPSVSGPMYGQPGQDPAHYEVPYTSQPGYGGQSSMWEGPTQGNPPPYGGGHTYSSGSGYWLQGGPG